jgi:hypothetical protein
MYLLIVQAEAQVGDDPSKSRIPKVSKNFSPNLLFYSCCIQEEKHRFICEIRFNAVNRK